MDESKNRKEHRGGCHCGQVAFEVTGEIADVLECNCSICTKKGFIHWIVPKDAFHLLTPAENLATYRFNTGIAQHHFCPTCGIASFYIPRSDPDKVDINLRCVEGIDLSQYELGKFDGQNWERALEERNQVRDED